MPISWGVARRVFLGRQSYGSPIGRVWVPETLELPKEPGESDMNS